MFLVAPGDILERRRLIVVVLCCCSVGLVATALAPAFAVLAGAAFAAVALPLWVGELIQSRKRSY